MASKKFYVVWNGRKPGIYKTWAECEAQTKGYQGARFKSFPSEKEAEEAFSKAPSSQARTTSTKTVKNSTAATGSYIEESISVDAACSGNPGMMEYQGVATKTGQVIFHFGPILGTNNIGEFLAIVHALSLLKKQGLETTIYTDSQTAMSWVRNKKANTSLVKNAKTDEVWDMIHRAENWLKENTYKNKILKWETKQFGEIKADFGRK